jgi:hypothetical protein
LERTQDQTLEKARALLKAKQFDQARSLLLTSNHPMAQQWIEQIDIRTAGQGSTTSMSGLSVRAPLGSEDYSDDDLIRPLTTGRITSLPAVGFGLMVFVALVGGVLLGYGLYYSTYYAYAIVVSAWVAAFIGGSLLRIGIQLGGVRHARSAFWVGLIMGLVLYGTYRYALYQDYVGQLSQESVRPGIVFPSEEAVAFADDALERLTEQRSIVGHMLLSLRVPVLLSVENEILYPEGNFSSDDQDLGVGLLIVEILFAVLTPARMAANTAQARQRSYMRRPSSPIVVESRF